MSNDQEMARRREAYREFKALGVHSRVRLAEEWSGTPPLKLPALYAMAHPTHPWVYCGLDEEEISLRIDADEIKPFAAWLLSLIGERIDEQHEEGEQQEGEP